MSTTPSRGKSAAKSAAASIAAAAVHDDVPAAVETHDAAADPVPAAEPAPVAEAPVAHTAAAAAAIAETSAPSAAVFDASQFFGTVAAQARESYEGFVHANQEQAARHFEETVTKAKEQVEQASAKVLQGFEELADFAKDNVEAVIQSGGIAARGAEDLGRALAACSQASFDRSVAAGKALLQAKSPLEFATVQCDFTRESADAFLAESTRLTQLAATIATDALAPLTARVTAAFGQWAKPFGL